jgi:hypothetical protein
MFQGMGGLRCGAKSGLFRRRGRDGRTGLRDQDECVEETVSVRETPIAVTRITPIRLGVSSLPWPSISMHISSPTTPAPTILFSFSSSPRRSLQLWQSKHVPGTLLPSLHPSHSSPPRILLPVRVWIPSDQLSLSRHRTTSSSPGGSNHARYLLSPVSWAHPATTLRYTPPTDR